MEQSSSLEFQYYLWVELMSKQKTKTLSYAILTERQIMRNRSFFFGNKNGTFNFLFASNCKAVLSKCSSQSVKPTAIK